MGMPHSTLLFSAASTDMTESNMDHPPTNLSTTAGGSRNLKIQCTRSVFRGRERHRTCTPAHRSKTPNDGCLLLKQPVAPRAPHKPSHAQIALGKGGSPQGKERHARNAERHRTRESARVSGGHSERIEQRERRDVAEPRELVPYFREHLRQDEEGAQGNACPPRRRDARQRAGARPAHAGEKQPQAKGRRIDGNEIGGGELPGNMVWAASSSNIVNTNTRKTRQKTRAPACESMSLGRPTGCASR